MTKTYLCIMDILPSGRIAALEIEAGDALEAERAASVAGSERFGGPVEVLEVVRFDLAA